MGSFVRCLPYSSNVEILSHRVDSLIKLQRFIFHPCLHQFLHCYHQEREKLNLKTGHHESFSRDKWFDLLKSCSTKFHILQLHGHLIRTSLIQDVNASVAFLSHTSLYTRLDLDYPLVVFNQIKKPSVFHYNVMIKGFSKSSSPWKAFNLYTDMQREGFHVDTISVSFILKSCNRVSCLIGGKQLHGRILQDGQQSDSLLLTSLMDLYASCRNGSDAEMIFYEMSVRDVVAWNVLISCYIRNGRTRDVLELFDAMQLPPYSLKPDKITCLLMLQTSANLNALNIGEKIHKCIELHGYDCTLYLQNSLISMYSKCGLVDKAFDVFNKIRRKNLASWSSLISGLSMNGHGREALRIFEEMKKGGIMPDEHTLTGVLSAYTHSGLLDEGIQFFKLIKTDFGISPNIHHYGCMVNLLSRSGFLDETYGFIMNSMNVKPDSTIWRTLLGACKMHGHCDLGERVIGHLIELKAQEAGDYVLLLNIHESAGNLERVVEIKKLMVEKGVQISPGCSTLELHGVVHEFITDDSSHPMKSEIYKMLDEIKQQLRMGGYIANMDVCEIGQFSNHSEKLAIAFAMFSTPPGTKIKIANNLSICVDCHSFAKFLSSVYNRTVIIRDRSRFHHFRKGRCSCNDCW